MDHLNIAKKISNIIKNIKHNIAIPIGISNRHIHLCKEDYDILFPNEEIKILKELSQPGFYATSQTVTIIGKKSSINNVRLLVPLREKTQVEISKTDARILGINSPIKLSGDLDEAENIRIKTKDGEIDRKAAIIAKRHIHLNDRDCEILNLKAGDNVSIKIVSECRSTIFEDVEIRPAKNSVLELHIDTDEANASGCVNDAKAYFIE